MMTRYNSEISCRNEAIFKFFIRFLPKLSLGHVFWIGFKGLPIYKIKKNPPKVLSEGVYDDPIKHVAVDCRVEKDALQMQNARGR